MRWPRSVARASAAGFGEDLLSGHLKRVTGAMVFDLEAEEFVDGC